jgi:hypothetical protein
MNQKNPTIQAMLTHLAEGAALPGEIDLWPSLQVSLRTNQIFSQKSEPAMQTHLASQGRFRLAVVLTLAIFLSLAMLFATPQGRIWAQNVLRFFTHTGDGKIMPTSLPVNLINVTPGSILPSLTLVPASHSAFFDVCGEFLNPRCSLDQIRSMVRFPIKAIAEIPQGMAFLGASGGPDGVTLVYQSAGAATVILLDEGPTSDFMEKLWQAPESATVETVQIDHLGGEYLKGAWIYRAGERIANWDPNEDIQILRWEEDGFLFTLTVIGKPGLPTTPLDKLEMVKLAQGLAVEVGEAPSVQSTETDPKSVARVEELAGFAVAEPSWLPEGYYFDQASYSPETRVVCLEYRHPADNPSASDLHPDPVTYPPSLTIAESAAAPLPTTDDLFSVSQIGQPVMKESIEVGGALDGKGLFARGNLNGSADCSNRFESQVLHVQIQGLSFSIFARQDGSQSGHNWLTRLQMVRLAESITGVQTIAADQIDPEFLTSASQAESLAGFHIGLPTKLPAGMVLGHLRFDQIRTVQTVVVTYSDGNNVLKVTEVKGSTDTLESVVKDHPEIYDPVTVHFQPALISQGYWANDAWQKLEDGGDGAASVIWFEGGIKYTVSGFNAFSRSVWLAIAESLM